MTDPHDAFEAAIADRYQLERELGRGGMATVYLARDIRHRRQVALKALHPDLAHALGAARFLREIETAANLHHPHILPLFDSGEAAGILFYVMPYVAGESLRDRISRERQLSVDDALRISAEVADALEAAHAQGVIHRDIKPENIMLSGEHALVADFGIAMAVSSAGGTRLTETGLAVGTAAYMSPEQAAGERDVDHRSDVYALGCVLYEMLAGEPPFTGPTAQAIIAKRFSGEAPGIRRTRPAVPATLEGVVARALAAVPSDRWPTAAAFRQAIEAERHPAIGVPPARVSRTGSRWPLVAAAGASVLAVTALWLLARHPAGGGALAHAGAPASAPRSLAVLPLVNVGGDTAQEYFSDGMTDELTSALGKVPGLRVAARSSAFAFKGKPADVREVGAKLHVATVLEGSVRRAGPRLRVAAQLVNAADGLALWSETYEREIADVFSVQEDIARSIAQALQVTLVGPAPASTPAASALSVEAHDLYLKGRFHFNLGSETGLRRSLELYQAALARDSTYAPAWGGIADTWIWLADNAVAPTEGYPKAKAAAFRAIGLDSTLGDAHAVLGLVLLSYEWNLTAAKRELERAIALNPNAADPWHYYGWALLADSATLDSATAVMRRAASLDPLSPASNADVSTALWMQGRNDEALAEARRTIAIDPSVSVGYEYAGLALLDLGRLDEALASFREAKARGAPADGEIVMTLAALGRRDEAARLLKQLDVEAGRRYIGGERLAMAHAALGERDAAFGWLETAYRQRSANLIALHTAPVWRNLRSDRRFESLVRRIGIRR